MTKRDLLECFLIDPHCSLLKNMPSFAVRSECSFWETEKDLPPQERSRSVQEHLVQSSNCHLQTPYRTSFNKCYGEILCRL